MTPRTPADLPRPDPRAVLDALPLGRRVVVRFLIEDGDRATDAVGQLTARDEEMVSVTTRAGTVRIELDQVVVAKEVPASPAGAWRIPPFLRRAGVAVLDLDGVVRTFDAAGDVAEVERGLGLPAQGLVQLALSLPVATQMLTGGASHGDWSGALLHRLVEHGHDPDVAADAVRVWARDHGSPVSATVELVDDLLAAGTPTFIFSNGTDRVPTELESLGLTRLVPLLLSSAELGAVKPDPQAYALAHARIEARLGRRVGRGEVHFTDDRPANVEAARVFGWQARVFTPASAPRRATPR